jgi:hypothetical protein
MRDLAEIRRGLLCLLAVAAVALALAGSGGAGRSGVPRGYALLTVLRAPVVTDPGSFHLVPGDGGGWVRSVQFGLDAAGHRTRLACRLASVDRSGKTPFQSDPLGACAVYFPTDRVIELTETPDYRSTAAGWEARRRAFGSGVVIVSGCTEGRKGYCETHPAKVKLVVSATGEVNVRFTLKEFALRVNNTDPAFGLVEDHGRGQVGISAILCGKAAGSLNKCWALYEYGTRPVLDAQWDPSQTLTVHWDGCDPGAPNQQLCPVTMTRNRTVSIYWH